MGTRQGSERRALRIAVLIVVLGLLGALTPWMVSPASAGLYGPVPANFSGDLVEDFVDNEPLFAYVRSDIAGGAICVVKADVESPTCDDAVYPKKTVVGIGTMYTLVEAGPLIPGEFVLLVENSVGDPLETSYSFFVSPCTSGCDTNIGQDAVDDFKAMAGNMYTSMDGMCTLHGTLEKVAGKATGMRGYTKEIKAPKLVFTVSAGSASYSTVLAGGQTLLTIQDPLTANINKALEIMKDLSCQAAKMYEDIRDDPPDPNFDQVAEPEFATIPPQVPSQYDDAIREVDGQRGVGVAVFHALERYQGAVVADDVAGQLTQAVALGDGATELAERMRASASTLRAWADAAALDPALVGPVLTQADLDQLVPLYERVRSTGFAPEELTQFAALGYSEEQVADIRTHFSQDIAAAPVDQTYSDALRVLASEAESRIPAALDFARHAYVIASRLDALPVNNPPTADNQSIATTQDTPVQVTLTGSDPDGDSLTYANVTSPAHGDLSGSAPNLIYTPTAGYVGSDSFTFTSNDGTATSEPAVVSITVESGVNRPPSAEFVADPFFGPAPLHVVFDASGSQDPDGSIASYAWDFGDGATGEGISPTHDYTAVGVFTVTLTVTDDRGATATASSQVSVGNAVPNAFFTQQSSSATSPVDVLFDAQLSEDPDGTIASFAWDFGDGTTGSGETVTHRYTTDVDTAFVVTLIVTDNLGAVGTHQSVVYVAANQPPAATFVADPSFGSAPLHVEFDASGSQDPDGSIASYAWEFGDGARGEGISPTHDYTAVGVFTVTLTVTDDRGATATASSQLSVGNDVPNAFFTHAPDSGRSPVDVLFDAQLSEDPDGTIASFAWDFGDGTTGSGEAVTHRYTTAVDTAFVVTLTVTDNLGAVGTHQSVVYVAANQQPVAVDDTARAKPGTPITVAVLANDSDPEDDPLSLVSASTPTHGSATCVPTGDCTYTANLGFDGTDQFTYTISDDRGATATGTVTVIVQGNHAPIASDDYYAVERKDAFDVLANDTDPNGDPLTVISTTAPAHGTVACSALGACTYTSEAGYVGSDTFGYTVTDPDGATASAQVGLTVLGRNVTGIVAPVVSSDSLTTRANEPVTANVLENDIGPQGSALTITATSSPSHGTVSCAADGACTYTPHTGFTGFDGFSYTVSDGGVTSIGPVLVTVVAPDADFDLSVTGGPTELTQGDSADWTVGLASRPEGLPQEWATLNAPQGIDLTATGPQAMDLASVHTAAGWTVSTTANGLRLTPGPNALLGESTVDALPAPLPPISQGTGGDGHVPILVGRKVFAFFHHQNPTSVSCVDRETGALCPGYPHQLNVSASDIIGPAAVVDSRLYVTVAPSPHTATRAPAVFCWDTRTNETCGLVIAERYTANSEALTSAPRLVGGKVWFAGGDQLYCVDPATNAPCTPTSTVSTQLTRVAQGSVDVVAHGTRVFIATSNGQVACVDTAAKGPCTGWSTPKDLEGSNLVNRYDATGAITGVCVVQSSASRCINDATPDRIDDIGGWPNSDGYYNITEEAETGTRTLWGSLSVGGLGCWDWVTNALCEGGSYVDGWIYGLPSAYGATFDGSCAVGLGDPGQVFTVDPAGTSPCTSLSSGTARRVVDLRDQRCDNTVGSATWDQVRVSSTDLTPGVEFNALVVTVRDATTGAILATREMTGTDGRLDLSTIDAEQHPALALDANASSAPGNPGWVDGNPPRIQLMWNSDPTPGCVRTTTTIDCARPSPLPVGLTVRTEPDGTSATAEVSLIRPSTCSENDPPVASGQSVSTAEDTAVGMVLSGSDPDSDPLTFAVVGQPVHGTLSGSAPNLVYTPAAGYVGADSFSFTVNDGLAASPAATVSITVTPVNDPPVASGQSVSTAEDTAVPVVLSGSDPDSDPLTFAVVGQPVHGTLSGSAPNLIYTPAVGYFGSDEFTFRVNDGVLDSATATVSITVAPVNDPPVAGDDSLITDEDTAGTVAVISNDTDADGDLLSVTSLSPVAAHGTVACSSLGLCTYTPAPGFVGADSFQYAIDDGHGGTATATVMVTVTPVNDPPVASGQSVSTPEDTAVGVVLSGSDPDNDPLTFAVVGQPAHGTLSGSAPNLVYTPAAGYVGPDSFAFTASDGSVSSSAATVSITVMAVNDPPSVDAGSSVSGNVGVSLTLEGSATDPDDDSLEVRWTISGPCTLGAPNAASTSVSCTAAGTFVATLTADDGINPSVSDTTTVVIALPMNGPPTVDAGSPVSGRVGDSLSLAGSASDPDGDTLTYSWAVAGPCTLGTSSAPTTTVTCTAAGTYTATLTVADGVNPPVFDTTSVDISEVPTNRPPSVDAGPNVSGKLGSTLTLKGSASDPDGDTLTYSWAVAGPCTLGASSAATTSVSCTAAGIYTATLTVTDGVNQPVSDTTSMTITKVTPGDTVLPECSAKDVSWKGFVVKVRDTGSGLASIQVTEARHSTVDVSKFTKGTTDPVLVTVRSKLLLPAVVELKVTDVAGNTRWCRFLALGFKVCQLTADAGPSWRHDLFVGFGVRCSFVLPTHSRYDCWYDHDRDNDRDHLWRW